MNKSESKYFNTAVKMDMALIALLKEKSFEYITIRELCKTAGVNRSTFYLHYETISDLLEETARYLLDDFLSYFVDDTKSVALDLRERKLEELVFVCDKYLLPYLTYIRDHDAIFRTVLSYGKTFGFEEVYRQMFENIFDPILDRFQYPEADRKYVMMYYLNGLNAIVLEWLKDGCRRSPQDISAVITRCIFGRNRE